MVELPPLARHLPIVQPPGYPSMQTDLRALRANSLPFTEMSNQSADTARAFWALVKKGDRDECWDWAGKRDCFGYGKAGGNVRAHRLAYELARGPIPPGLVLRRRKQCGPLCCNPEHLMPRSRVEVGHEMAAAGKLKPRPNPDIWRLRHAEIKVTPEVREEIRRRYKPRVKGCGAKALAKELGLHYSTVWRVANGITSRQRKPSK
jgi:hypothetical protein